MGPTLLSHLDCDLITKVDLQLTIVRSWKQKNLISIFHEGLLEGSQMGNILEELSFSVSKQLRHQEGPHIKHLKWLRLILFLRVA